MSGPDYRDSKWLPALQWALSLGRRVISAIVLHSTTATAEQLAANNGDSVPASAHYHVAPNGQITQHVREFAVAYHMASARKAQWTDPHTIGIVLERADDREPWPDVQILAVARLVAAIRLRHPDLPVHTHAEVTRPASTIDDPRDWPMLEMEVCVDRILRLTLDPPPIAS